MSALQTQEAEYERIISKLVQDDLIDVALSVAKQAQNKLGLNLAIIPELEAKLSEKRSQLSLNANLLSEATDISFASSLLLSPNVEEMGSDDTSTIPKKREFEDLDDEKTNRNDDAVLSAPFPRYLPYFSATHRAPVTVAAFSQCGKWASTGAADGSVKILSVKRMKEGFEGGIAALAAANVGSTSFTRAPLNHSLLTAADPSLRAVVKTYTEHRGPVVDLSFHPTEQVVMSASEDRVLRFYDHYKVQRGSFKELVDPCPIRSAQFHPSGDFIAVAALHPIIRIYDTSTFKAYVPSAGDTESTTTTPSHHHTDAINMVRWAPAGNMYCSASQDGTVKLWDTITGELVRVLTNAHSSMPVTSAQFTPSGKLIYTSGLDSQCLLWDVNTGKCVAKYAGAVQKRVSCVPCMTSSGNHIISGDEDSNGIVAWDLRTSEIVKRIPSAHNGPVRWIASSPVEEAIISGGVDDRLKFWTLDPEEV